MVYYPIFGTRQDQYLQNVVDPAKDVEGLTHKYISNMYRNVRFLDESQQLKSVLPCTPLAVIKILEHLQIYNNFLPYGNRLHGHTVTVINRSEVVGRPLAALLANDGAVVYSKDVDDVQQYHRGQGLRKRRHEVEEKPGWGLEQILPLSDVVISGVPGDKFKVPVHLLREGAVCINFSSEKVSQSCRCRVNHVTLTVAELHPRGQGEGLHLRSGHWQVHHCCAAEEPAPHFSEQECGCPGQACIGSREGGYLVLDRACTYRHAGVDSLPRRERRKKQFGGRDRIGQHPLL